MGVFSFDIFVGVRKDLAIKKTFFKVEVGVGISMFEIKF